MSLGILEESVDAAPPRRSITTILTINTLPGSVSSTIECGIDDADVLFDRVAGARALFVEHPDGVGSLPLQRLGLHESDTQWFTRVLTSVLPHVGDAEVACALVATAFERRVAAPVSVEFRPDEAPHGGTSLAGPQRKSSETAPREIPLMHSATGAWVAIDSTGTLDPKSDTPDLVGALISCLRAVEEKASRQQHGLRRQLARAVSRGDGQGFVDAAAELMSGPVCLKDSTGTLVAISDGARVKDCVHQTPLHDDVGLRGTLLTRTTHPGATGNADPDLTDLAMALLTVRTTTSECHLLENRLAVMSHFVDRSVDSSRPEQVDHCHRLVMIRSASDSGRAQGSLLARVLAESSAVPLLSGLSLVARPDAIFGAYSDDGSSPDAHQQTWQRLLHAVDVTDSLRVVISGAAESSKHSNRQHRAIEQISHLQQDDSGYFALPPVVVFDHLGPLAGVLHAMPGQQVVPYVRRVLGDLITDDRFGGQLIETLYAYLQTGGSPRGAGALLHLHGSSVKYRMRVVRELLGDRLDDPDKRFDLELALRLYLAGRSLNGEVAS